jgi:saccharopine dehydrogenase-like NADP-dependent oxidoreductase
MTPIAVVGCGKVGRTIVELLASTGDYAVTAIDTLESALAALPDHPRIARQPRLPDGLARQLAGQFALVNASPFHATGEIATAAAQAGVHYLDLTEDVASTQVVHALAAGAATRFIPQCGLAPGFISILGIDLARRFDALDTLRLRVGALPLFPSNALGYNLTWSVEGVINEYLQPCEAICEGRRIEVPALEEIEQLALDGVTYEAFNTSGGLGSLVGTLQGRVRTLNYRTLRYPGHRDIMKLLLKDLRLGERPEQLRQILEFALPGTDQDVVVIFATATGQRDGRHWQESRAIRVPAQPFAGRWRTAIALTTAASVCATLELLVAGELAGAGALRQEQIPLERFLANRFGAVFAAGARAVPPGSPRAGAAAGVQAATATAAEADGCARAAGRATIDAAIESTAESA